MRTDLKENSFKLQPEARGRHALNEEKKQAIRSSIMSPEHSTKISHDHKIDAVSLTHTKSKVFRDHKQAIQEIFFFFIWRENVVFVFIFFGYEYKMES